VRAAARKCEPSLLNKKPTYLKPRPHQKAPSLDPIKYPSPTCPFFLPKTNNAHQKQIWRKNTWQNTDLEQNKHKMKSSQISSSTHQQPPNTLVPHTHIQQDSANMY
jgi:hypothetical protein